MKSQIEQNITSKEEQRTRLYSQMFLIRTFEEEVLKLFSQGLVTGTTHTSIGQEADAVGVINALRDGDVIFSNHRCHGHYLAFSDNTQGLLDEIMGRATGICGGRGGSQHLFDGNFYSNGILGGTVPAATGVAMAEKLKGSSNIVVCFMGDGTMGEGIVYESLNMASLWNLPIIFVVENNWYAQSTPFNLAVAGDLVDRGRAFGISSHELDTTDVEIIYSHMCDVVEKVRSERRPHFQVLNTYRLTAHSKGDDDRPEEEIEARREFDPIRVMAERVPSVIRDVVESEVTQRMKQAIQRALDAPFPDPASLDGPASR